MDNLIKCQKNYTISFEFWIQIMVYKIIYVLDMYSLFKGYVDFFHCTDGIIISIIKGKVLWKLINILLNDSMVVVK